MTKGNKKGHAGLIIFHSDPGFSSLAEVQVSISISDSSHEKQWNIFLTA
mgnify:CR=1 FL=1